MFCLSSMQAEIVSSHIKLCVKGNWLADRTTEGSISIFVSYDRSDIPISFDFLSQRGLRGGTIATDNDYISSCHLGTLSNDHATISYSRTRRILLLDCCRSHSSPSRSFSSVPYITVKFRTTFPTRIYPTLSKTYPFDMFCCVDYKYSC